MAKFLWNKALEEYAIQLGYLANDSSIYGKAVYAMADIVANNVRASIDALPAHPDVEGILAWKTGRKASLTISEKRALQEGFGISPMQKTDGWWNVKLGFDGYDGISTDNYPGGKPIPLLARAVESGSSVREKTPFIRPAVNKSKKQAIEACQNVIDEEMKQRMDG